MGLNSGGCGWVENKPEKKNAETRKTCQLKNNHEIFERFLYKFPRCIITTITRLSTDLTKFLHNRWHFCTLSWGAQGWITPSRCNLWANILQMSQLRSTKSTGCLKMHDIEIILWGAYRDVLCLFMILGTHT